MDELVEVSPEDLQKALTAHYAAFQELPEGQKQALQNFDLTVSQIETASGGPLDNNHSETILKSISKGYRAINRYSQNFDQYLKTH